MEKALLTFCSDQLNLSKLQNDGDQTDTRRSELSRVRQNIANLNKMLDRVTAAMIADEETTPIVFVRKARELENQIEEAKRDEARAETDLNRANQRNIPAIAHKWHQLAAEALSLDYDARMRVRQMVLETFERIVIYHKGTTPNSTAPRHIDLILIPHGGASRMLRINRKTGSWIAMESVLNSNL